MFISNILEGFGLTCFLEIMEPVKDIPSLEWKSLGSVRPAFCFLIKTNHLNLMSSLGLVSSDDWPIVALVGHSFGCQNLVVVLEISWGWDQRCGSKCFSVQALGQMLVVPCLRSMKTPLSLFQNSSSRWSCLLSSWCRHFTYTLCWAIIAFIGQLENYVIYSILFIKIGHVLTGSSFTHMSIFFF